MNTATPSQSISRLIRRSIVLAVFLLGLAQLVTSGADSRSVLVVQVDGTITPVMANYIERGIDEATKRNAAAVVLQMDTPGGLSSATDDIIRAILASQVPVVVYIAPEGARAGSAGVYITYAAHVAAMAPTTNIGSATPVFVGSDGSTGEEDTALHRKAINDAVAQIRGLAELRGRNADWAEQAVRDAANVTSSQALDLNVVDYVADDLPALLTQIDGSEVSVAGGEVRFETAGASIEPLGMNFGERLYQIISDPTIAYLMLSLGMLGLFLEFSNPGAILPGVAGGIFILLALFGLGSLDVNWAGIALMAFAFLLFVVDLFVPSHGLLTVGGIIAFALGSIMLANSMTAPEVSIPTSVILIVTVTLALFFALIAGSVIRARLRPSTTGQEGLIGEVGTVRQPLEPKGYAFVDGELWQARSASGWLPIGTHVRVTAVDGLMLTVEPVTAETTETTPTESSTASGSRLRPLRFRPR